MKIVILKDELPGSDSKWKLACDKKNLDYEVVDLATQNWYEKILMLKPDILLLKPSGLTTPYKEMFDERLSILVNEKKLFCYPSLKEVKIYENKKFFSYWLKANDIPHPKTFVFYYQREALQFVEENNQYPIVAKTNIGASGSGVKIVKDKESLVLYIHDTFSGKGSNKRIGPSLKKGKWIKRGLNLILRPKKIRERIEVYESRAKDIQKDFVLFQEYIAHEYEWRVVRIGDSYFAHKKMLLNEKTSGALLKTYSAPPLHLLDFVKKITTQHQLDSVAVDLFEKEDGYLINEIQCIFGQSDNYQMKVDDKIGRYIFIDNSWCFEEGNFNDNENYDLRLEHAINKYKS